jgi:4-amino-4-deoxy-L-arabinose transferase-like glycosyltransferase
MTSPSSVKNTADLWSKDILYVALILFLGLGLRLWGVTWGFPRIDLNPDELNVFNISSRLTLKDLNPHYYSYCGLTFYLNYFSTHLLSLFHFNMDSVHRLLVHRLLNVFWGTLTILLCYLSAKDLFDNKRAAYIAAAFMSMVPLHVWDSHFGTTDIGLTFWMTFAFWLGIRAYRKPSMRNYLLGGLVVGLAMGVKFNGALAAVSFLAAAILTFTERRISGQKAFLCLVVAFIGTLLAFFVASPYSFLDYNQTIAAFHTESIHSRILGHFGFDLSAEGWQYHRFIYQIFAAFPFSLGFFLWLASLAGMLFFILKSRHTQKILGLSFVALYFLIFASWKFVPIRYYLPVMPILIIISSFLFNHLLTARPKWGWLALLLVFSYTLAFSMTTTYRFTKDTRLESASWAVHHLKPRTRIFLVDPHFNYSYSPVFDSNTFLIRKISLRDVESGITNHTFPTDSIFCLSSLDYGRYYRDKKDLKGIQIWDSIRRNPAIFYKIKYFTSRFLNKSFYVWLDPMFEGYFVSPTIEYYEYIPERKYQKNPGAGKA